MKLLFENIRISLENDKELRDIAARRLRCPVDRICGLRVLRRSVDARNKNNICFVYSLEVETEDTPAMKKIAARNNLRQVSQAQASRVSYGDKPVAHRPVVAGFGPAGMLAAYMLAKAGFRPLVFERGEDVDRRAGTVAEFWNSGRLDENSNVQFGEGGAGAFSDGKLTCRNNDPLGAEILRLFVECGAPPEIMYDNKPHIGTDRLRPMVKSLRELIRSYGGEVHFGKTVQRLETSDGKLEGIVVDGVSFAADTLFLCIGHSARDTYRMLEQQGIGITGKAFSVGVRIEHPQTMIDEAQYGRLAGHKKLGPADYALVFQDRQLSRTAYTFCMCPGGRVVAAASEQGGIAVNGMSNYLRDSGTANAALVVNVTPDDFGSSPLDGVEFQRRIERAAYTAAGGGYKAPFQTVGKFLGIADVPPVVIPSYSPAVVDCELKQVLPDFVTSTMANALKAFAAKMPGYANSGIVLTAPETRTSAPCRITRAENFQSVNTAGVYPVGEGAGYAGGIMSAACDGVRAAKIYISQHKPEN